MGGGLHNISDLWNLYILLPSLLFFSRKTPPEVVKHRMVLSGGPPVFKRLPRHAPFSLSLFVRKPSPCHYKVQRESTPCRALSVREASAGCNPLATTSAPLVFRVHVVVVMPTLHRNVQVHQGIARGKSFVPQNGALQTKESFLARGSLCPWRS